MPARAIKVAPLDERKEGGHRERRLGREQLHHEAPPVRLDAHAGRRPALERGQQHAPHRVPVVGVRLARGDRDDGAPGLCGVGEPVRRDPPHQVVVRAGHRGHEPGRHPQPALGARARHGAERGDG